MYKSMPTNSLDYIFDSSCKLHPSKLKWIGQVQCCKLQHNGILRDATDATLFGKDEKEDNATNE